MAGEKIYSGIDKEESAGLTPTGNIIRDAWVFGLITEDEKCAGWSLNRIQTLYDRVYAAWEPYGHLVSQLPQELAERHARIYAAAINNARDRGWMPDIEDEI